MEGVGAGSRAPRRAGSVYFELLVTVGLFAIPATARAGWIAWYGRPLDPSEFRFINFALEELLIVALVVHIARLHGDQLTDFTRAARWSDAGWAVALFVAGALLQGSTVLAAHWLRGEPLAMIVQHDVEMFVTPVSASYLAFVLINPVCEETLMRAFLQTRLRQVGWSSVTIILASAGIQAAYHVYQGAPRTIGIAVVMVCWAWFYERTRRLWPLIGAHTIADVISMLVTSGLVRSA